MIWEQIRVGWGPGPRLHSQRRVSAMNGMSGWRRATPGPSLPGVFRQCIDLDFDFREVGFELEPRLVHSHPPVWGGGGETPGGVGSHIIGLAQQLPLPSPLSLHPQMGKITPLLGPLSHSRERDLSLRSQSPKSREWRTKRSFFLSQASQPGQEQNLKIKC